MIIITSRITRWSLGGVCGLILAGSPAAQPLPAESESEPLRTPTWSKSRFFHVSGGWSVYNARVAERAEDVLAEVEKRVGKPVPRFSNTPLFIELVDAANGRVMVEASQRYVDFSLHQRLAYPLGAENLEETMLEEMVRLLLNRYVLVELDTSERRKNNRIVPEWIAVGLAQQIFHRARERNREFVRDTYAQPAGLFPRDILAWKEVPEKNLRVRAACDLLLAHRIHEDRQFLATSLQTLAREGSIPQSVLGGSLRSQDERREQIRWDLWLAKAVMGKSKPGPFTQREFKAVEELMSLQRPSLTLFIPAEDLSGLTFPYLLEHAGEPWAGHVLFRLKMELFSIRVGKTGALQEWTTEMDALLSHILSVKPVDREAKSGRWIKQWLALERKRQAAMQQWLNVDQYLDTVEERLDASP